MQRVSYFIVAAIVAALFLNGCSRDSAEEPTPLSFIFLEVKNEIGTSPLVMNTEYYKNAAGNDYRVSHLEYYLSDFRFLNEALEWVKSPSSPVLINSETETTIALQAPNGRYTAFTCTVGIPESENLTNSLYPSIENINMAWPESMGGGYHFMKFEGYYADSTQTYRGFTVHLGKNGHQAINVMYGLSIDFSEAGFSYELVMNLNEWFESPHLYDFNVDGNYTMGVDTLMKKISENGENCISIR